MKLATNSGENNNPFASFFAHAGVTFFSALAVQISTFSVLALAGLLLPVDEFSQLSIVVATTMLSTALCDLGLNITSTKRYGETDDVGYLAAAFGIRLILLPLAGGIGWILMETGAPEIGQGILLGGLLNIWNGARSADQAMEDYRSLALSSLLFAIVRAAAGLWAVVQFRDSAVVATAIYAVPLAISLLSTSTRRAVRALSRCLPDLRGSARYAAYVHLNALAFMAIPYVPQFFISARFDAVTTGTYGLMLTFSAPVALVVNSIYNVLLPKMLRSKSIYEGALWSRRGLAALSGLAAVVVVFGFALSIALAQIYSHRFPEIQWPFVMYFSGMSISTIAGIYTLSVHTQGVPHINMFINVVRLIILILALLSFASDLMSVVQIIVAVMLVGQLVMVGWLAARRFAR